MASVSTNGLAAVFLSVGSIMAQQASPPAPQGGPAAFMGSVLPMMIVMFAIIYFLMIRPEQKKQKERRRMLDNLKKGDHVVTIGGELGIVGSVKDQTVMVKIADNAVVEYRKSAIAEVISSSAEPAKEAKK